jgi:hypothetical protein
MEIPLQIVNWKGILGTAVVYVKILFQNLPGKTDINHIQPVQTVASTYLFKDEDDWFLRLYVSTKQHGVTSYHTVTLTLQ